MPSTSKSDHRKKRNWLELPTDVTADILQRIGVADILENAQKVCTVWGEICKDPAMWRVIYMDTSLVQRGSLVCRVMCMQAVDRSQGQLIDLTVIGFFHSGLLQYVADRSSQLRRLEIVDAFYSVRGHWSEALKKLSSLEELSLVRTNVSKEDVEAAGRYCPLLKTLKLNQQVFSCNYDDDDEIALAIGKNLPELTHLELIGNHMKNVGLQAILDGCCHLELLDLRRCLSVNLKGRLGTRCSQQIQYLKLPHDSLEGCPHNLETYDYDDFDLYGGADIFSEWCSCCLENNLLG